MYVSPDFLRKKDLRRAVSLGRRVMVFQPSGIFPSKTDGDVNVEGPHYPRPHTWYAMVRVVDSVVIKVLR